MRRPGIYRSYIYRTAVDGTVTDFNYTVGSLMRNETYEVQITAQGEYRWCSRDLFGVASEPANVTTAAQGKYFN